jgi:predicted amidophosphoribosyltransferase
MTLRIAQVTGEPIDADLIETSTYEDPHYPICVSCEEESDDDSGYCSRCEQYADGTLFEPLSELKRTASGGWL